MVDMELVPGDVLLLDPEWIEDKKNNEVRQDCISLLICKLDNSPVSHAALYYKYDEKTRRHIMAEENLGGLVESPLPAPGESPRTVHIRRCNVKGCDMPAVLAAAATYLNNKEPYSLAGLICAGFLLLTKRYVDDPAYIKTVESCLRNVCELLLLCYPGTNPMTCAQFVACCYDAAGVELVPDAPESRAGGADAAAGVCLADRAATALGAPGAAAPVWTGASGSLSAMGSKGLEDQFERFCCTLLRLMEEWDGRKKSPRASCPEDAAAEVRAEAGDEALLPESFVNAASAFACIALHGVPESGAAMSTMTADASAGDLKKLRYAFVSPGDLFRSAKLSDAGYIPPKK